MTIAEKLYRLRTDNHLTQIEFSKIAGVSDKAVSTWERGEKEPRLQPLQKICAYFKLDINKFVDVNSDEYNPPLDFDVSLLPTLPVRRIPILGRVAAGLPLYADEQIIGYTVTTLNGGHEYFALRVCGDSMNALGINDGDNVIVRKQDYADDGQVAVVLVDGEDATIKRFYKRGTTVTLVPQSASPAHHPQIYDASKTQIRIIGVVVQSITDIT